MKKGKITFLGNLPEWLRRTIAGVLITALIGGLHTRAHELTCKVIIHDFKRKERGVGLKEVLLTL